MSNVHILVTRDQQVKNRLIALRNVLDESYTALDETYDTIVQLEEQLTKVEAAYNGVYTEYEDINPEPEEEFTKFYTGNMPNLMVMSLQQLEEYLDGVEKDED